jgi:formamidase
MRAWYRATHQRGKSSKRMTTCLQRETPLEVGEYVAVLDPSEPFVRGASSGTRIRVRTVPGCWGPMITPEIPIGHEVSRPVHVAGAEPGDAIAIKIIRVEQVTEAMTSGTHCIRGAYAVGDPGIAALCPTCNVVNPRTRAEGTAPDAIRCEGCGDPVTPYELAEGYTMIFDEGRRVGITVPALVARSIRAHARESMGTPAGARQWPANRDRQRTMPGHARRAHDREHRDRRDRDSVEQERQGLSMAARRERT